MTIEVTAEVHIARSPADVFDYLADMENNPTWQRGMQSCTWTSDPPLRLGSTYDQSARFLGREIVSSFEVTEFEPGERIRITTTGGSMPIDVTRSVEGDGSDASVVRAVVRGDSSGIFRIAAPLMRMMVQRSVRGDYRRLKTVLESA